MSYGIGLKYNDKVPIEFFFPNGDATKFVKAKVFSSDKTLLGEFNLTNDGEGKFSYNAFVMPDVDFIKVYFYVFDDVDYLVPSLVGGDIDLFYKVIDSGSSGSGSSGSDDEIIVLIEDQDIIALVDDNLVHFDNEVIAYIEEEEIFGYVEDDSIELIGLIENDDEEIICLVEN